MPITAFAHAYAKLSLDSNFLPLSALNDQNCTVLNTTFQGLEVSDIVDAVIYILTASPHVQVSSC
jgi:hypothetical protein